MIFLSGAPSCASDVEGGVNSDISVHLLLDVSISEGGRTCDSSRLLDFQRGENPTLGDTYLTYLERNFELQLIYTPIYVLSEYSHEKKYRYKEVAAAGYAYGGRGAVPKDPFT